MREWQGHAGAYTLTGTALAQFQAANIQPWKTDVIEMPFYPGLLTRALGGWDILDLPNSGTGKCGNSSCDQTVTLHGNSGKAGCYYAWDVNYVLFGWIGRLGGINFNQLLTEAAYYKSLKRLWPGDRGDVSTVLQFVSLGCYGWPQKFGSLPKPLNKWKQCCPSTQSLSGPMLTTWPNFGWEKPIDFVFDPTLSPPNQVFH